jgi:hypothetical protein
VSGSVTEVISLWSAPAGCLSAQAGPKPETVFALHLGADTPSLTLTTHNGTTKVDTAVYVLPSCAAETEAALGCNDDDGSNMSTLTLQDVHAGDYIVVVEQVSPDAGPFELSISTP